MNFYFVVQFANFSQKQIESHLQVNEINKMMQLKLLFGEHSSNQLSQHTSFVNCVISIGDYRFNTPIKSIRNGSLLFEYQLDADDYSQLIRLIKYQQQTLSVYYYLESLYSSFYFLVNDFKLVAANLSNCFLDNTIIRTLIDEEKCFSVRPNNCSLGDLRELSVQLSVKFNNLVTRQQLAKDLDLHTLAISQYFDPAQVYSGQPDFQNVANFYCIQCAYYKDPVERQNCRDILAFSNVNYHKSKCLSIVSGELNQTVLNAQFFLENSTFTCKHLFRVPDTDYYYSRVEIKKALLYKDQLFLQFQSLVNQLNENQKLLRQIRLIKAKNPNNHTTVTAELLSEYDKNFCVQQTSVREHTGQFRFSYITAKLSTFTNITNAENADCGNDTIYYVIMDNFLYENGRIVEQCKNQSIVSVVNYSIPQMTIYKDAICFNQSVSGSIVMWDLSGKTSQFLYQHNVTSSIQRNGLRCDPFLMSEAFIRRLQLLHRTKHIGYYLFDTQCDNERYQLNEVQIQAYKSSVYIHVVMWFGALFVVFIFTRHWQVQSAMLLEEA